MCGCENVGSDSEFAASRLHEALDSQAGSQPSMAEGKLNCSYFIACFYNLCTMCTISCFPLGNLILICM